MYADYEFYTDAYLQGLTPTLSEEEFNFYEQKAGAQIRKYTIGKADTYTGGDEVKMAACAVAEKLHEISQAYESMGVSAGVTSERVGEYSVSYSGNTFAERDSATKKEVQSILYDWLLPTGLLYRGLIHVY